MSRATWIIVLAIGASSAGAHAVPVYASPSALALSPDQATLYVAEEGPAAVAMLDLASGQVRAHWSLPAAPTGLALSGNGGVLYATCAGDPGTVCALDTAAGKVLFECAAGHTPMAPVLSPGEQRLYVCNRFDDTVSAIGLGCKREVARAQATREPAAAVLSADGMRLFVGNLLPVGPSSADYVAAEVNVIGTAQMTPLATIALPNGSGSVRGMALSPDGRYVYVTHILARFHMPTTQLERGWMNTNALSIIDVDRLELVNTVLLDDVDRGAANPWGVACSADGAQICVAHAGTHEISVIDAAGLHAKLAQLAQGGVIVLEGFPKAEIYADDVRNDLSFLVDLRRRIPLGVNGPRALVVADDAAYAAAYFTGAVARIDLDPQTYKPVSVLALGDEPEPDVQRLGRRHFNDAEFCFQGWQSCASCHPDARADGFNWDLLNDGLGNPKNAKSMLLAHQTPPAMVSGVRPDAETAVRAGMQYIQFTVRPESQAREIDAFLKHMTPTPSPHLDAGGLSEAAKRGKALYQREDVGCATCHPEGLYTDLKMHDVGTRGPLDRRADFDTPALVEAWRTGPFLHDGRSTTIMDVLTTDNPNDEHGRTSQLSEQELRDLAEYVLSL